MSFTATRNILVLAIIGLLSSTGLAQAAETSRSSKTISFTTAAELDQNTRDSQLKQAETDVMAPLLQTGYRPESGPMALYIGSASHASEYSIYDASTDLISDLDGDGFYHRFSVLIDADTIFTSADVYVRLFLSYEGGPWNLYTTSNNYHITGDSSLDSFVVETELADGFATGYYDIRIELYDAVTGTWLLSAGPYDDASLSTLPLEDSYRDDLYVSAEYPVQTEVSIAAAGTMSYWLLALPMLLLVARHYRSVALPARSE